MLKLLKYLKPYKAVAIMTVVLTLVNNGMSLILPYMMSLIINNGITDGDIDYIKKTGIIMLAISAVGVAASVLSSYCSSKASAGFGAELRSAVFTKVETMSECDIEKIGTPSLITRSTNDIRRIQELLLMGMRIIISAPIMMVGGCLMAVIINPKLSVSILIVVPVIALLAVFISKKVMPLFSLEQKSTDRLNKILREKLSGIRVIRAFNRTKYEDSRFKIANLELTSIALKINRTFAALIPIAVMMLFTLIIGVIWVGGRQIESLDALTHATEISDMVGDLQAFVIYLLMIVFAVSMAAAMIIMVPRSAISAKRINEILELELMIKEPEKISYFDENKKGELVFDSVSFGYPGAAEPVLNDISFESHAGEMTAIIGGTGSGKSTLVNLIPRFYDVSVGKITIDGTDIRKVTAHELHSKIGFIPQKALLFSGTIADNLRFGKPEASDDELWTALKIANADDFVHEAEDGLETVVSQNGTNFSGGQKQRLAIARAIVTGAEIFVFDDSFSALDFKTDAMLRAAIREQMSQANIIVVAQRVGTILEADRIIVLDEGKIVGIGRHKELLGSCKVYREIVESQFTEEDLEK